MSGIIGKIKRSPTLKGAYHVLVGTQLRHNLKNRIQNLAENLALKHAVPLGPNGARPHIQFMVADSNGGSASGRTRITLDLSRPVNLIKQLVDQKDILAAAAKVKGEKEDARLRTGKAIAISATLAGLATLAAGPFIGAALGIPALIGSYGLGALLASVSASFVGVGLVGFAAYAIGSKILRSGRVRTASKDLTAETAKLKATEAKIKEMYNDKTQREALAKHLISQEESVQEAVLAIFTKEGLATPEQQNLRHIMDAYRIIEGTEIHSAGEIVNVLSKLDADLHAVQPLRIKLEEKYAQPGERETLAQALISLSQADRESVLQDMATEKQVVLLNIVSAYELAQVKGLNYTKYIETLELLDPALEITRKLSGRLYQEQREKVAQDLYASPENVRAKLLERFETSQRKVLEDMIRGYELKEKLAAAEVEPSVFEEASALIQTLSSSDLQDLSVTQDLEQMIKTRGPQEQNKIRQKQYTATQEDLVQAYTDLETLKSLNSPDADVATQVGQIMELSRKLNLTFQASQIGNSSNISEIAILPADAAVIAKVEAMKDKPKIAGAAFINAGGQAEIYRAFDAKTDKFVAVKLLTAVGLEERFRKEAEAMAKVKDDGVLNVYASGKYQETPVFIMELMERPWTTLDQVVNEAKKLDARTTAKVAINICKAMAAVAKHNLSHRDLKPANIFVNSETLEVKIADFGLVKDFDAAEQSRTGMAMGTEEYMSPYYVEYGKLHKTDKAGREEIKNLARQILIKHDLFALGATLYVMVTGRHLTFVRQEDGKLYRLANSLRISKQEGKDPATGTSEDPVLLSHTGFGTEYITFMLAKNDGNTERMNEVVRNYRVAQSLEDTEVTIPKDFYEIIATLVSLDPMENYRDFVTAREELTRFVEGHQLGRPTMTDGPTSFRSSEPPPPPPKAEPQAPPPPPKKTRAAASAKKRRSSSPAASAQTASERAGGG
ncbi:serine/threonine-protein kinase [Candidatus Margulisiibacteriota bacterium]